MNKLIIDFSIFSNKYSYLFITDFLGVKYDDFCKKGGKINNNEKGAINEQYIWIKKSGLNETNNNLDNHLEKLFIILFPIKEKLLQLKEKGFEFQLSIVSYNYGKPNPGYHIESKYIQFLGEIGASIDSDIYCLGDN